MPIMKITIFSQHFWPEIFRINDVAKELSLTNKVTVVTGQPNYPKGKIFEGYNYHRPKISFLDKIKIIRLPIIARSKGKSYNLIFNYLSFIISGFFYKSFIKKNITSDIIFIYGTSPILQAIPGIILGKAIKVPIVLWVQDLWPESLSDTGYIKNKLMLKLVNSIVMFIYEKCDRILLQSPEFLSHHNIKPYSQKCQVHYNPSEFKDSENILNLKKKNIFTLIYSGNIGKVQNLEFILDLATISIKNNWKVNFIIIGNGSEKNKFIKKVRALKLNSIIIFEEFQKKDDLKKMLSNCDSLILTLDDGIVLKKTIPAKLQTYLFFSKPIFSVSSGIVEKIIIKNNLGFSSKHSNKLQIKKNFTLLYKMSLKEKKIIGKNCYNYYLENFEIKKNCKSLNNIFEEIVQKRK